MCAGNNTRAMAYAATDPARLRRLGLRATAPRLAVLAMLAEVGGHRSADELVAALRKAGYPHARTTVYNALQDLARAGLVHDAPVTAGALRYEADTAPHHHFVCRHCGLVVNIPMSDEVRVPNPAINAVEVNDVEVVYRGLCERCAKAGVGEAIDLRQRAGLREAGEARPPGTAPHGPEAIAVVRGETRDRL